MNIFVCFPFVFTLGRACILNEGCLANCFSLSPAARHAVDAAKGSIGGRSTRYERTFGRYYTFVGKLSPLLARVWRNPLRERLGHSVVFLSLVNWTDVTCVRSFIIFVYWAPISKEWFNCDGWNTNDLPTVTAIRNMILFITTTIIVIGFLIRASIRPKNFPPGKWLSTCISGLISCSNHAL